MGESRIGRVGRGIGSEELGVACGDNFGAKFDCERGQRNGGGAGSTCVEGRVLGAVLLVCVCDDGKD